MRMFVFHRRQRLVRLQNCWYIFWTNLSFQESTKMTFLHKTWMFCSTHAPMLLQSTGNKSFATSLLTPTEMLFCELFAPCKARMHKSTTSNLLLSIVTLIKMRFEHLGMHLVSKWIRLRTIIEKKYSILNYYFCARILITIDLRCHRN